MFAINLNELSGFAIQAGKLAFGVVILLSIQVFVYRIKLIFLNKRQAHLKKVWRPFINGVICGEDVQTVQINKKDLYFILEEINYVFSVIKGEEADRLRIQCLSVGLQDRLFKLLKSNNVKKKLYAIITFGNLHYAQSFSEIEKNMLHKQTIISLMAARSMIQIDADKALQIIMPTILSRRDWPWANIAHILKMAGSARICKPLSELIQTIPASMQASFLRLYEVMQCEEISPVTKEILEYTEDDKVASVCLHISQDPAILPLVKKYATHDRWHVRMHAATALGRFGGENDIPILTDLLKDREWWVRYRAAQALANLPFMHTEQLEALRESVNDRYASDILGQVIKEKDR